jgi:hypothetical protein
MTEETTNPMNSIKIWQARRQSLQIQGETNSHVAHTKRNPSRNALFASMFLGFGLLLTFQFSLNLITYFEFILEWPEVGYYVGLVTTYPSLIVQFVMLSVGNQIKAGYRIQFSFYLNAIVLMSIILIPANRGAILTILSLSGIGTATLEASLFGYLSTLGMNGAYSAAASSGCAMAGVIACLIQILSRGILPPIQAAILYCSIGVIILIACIYVFHKLEQLQLVENPPEMTKNEQSKPESDASNPYSISGMVQKEKIGSLQSSDPSEVIRNLNVSDIFANLHRAAKLVFFPCLSIYLQFVATFLVFPGLMSTVRYRGIDRTIEQDFFSFLNLTFSLADLVGRLVAPIHSPLSDYQLLIYSISRFMWAPLCFGLAKEWNGFETDFITWIIMLGFGFTNGHVVALCTMASSRIKESERELAGFVTIACLHFGIVTGSNLALIFEATS